MNEKNNRNRNKVKSSVNPQGLSEDTANQTPKSVLEDRAKKKNTKIQVCEEGEDNRPYIRLLA